MAMNHLQKITTRAKQLRKANPKLIWTDAVKKASKEYSSNKTIKKSVGALPVGFKGNIWGINFKIVNQYDIYNNVSAIVEDTKNGKTIVVFDGIKSAKELSFNFAKYIYNHFQGNLSNQDSKQLEQRLQKFCVQMQKEVKEFNAGKSRTIKKQPLIIAKPKTKPAVKKAATKKPVEKKKVHTKWKVIPAHERRVAGMERHKDTKSHNVNIRVVSGSKTVSINQKRNEIEKDLLYYKQAIERIKKELPIMSTIEKKRARETIKLFNNIQKNLKAQLKIHNSLIVKLV